MALLKRRQQIEIKSDFLFEFESGEHYTPFWRPCAVGAGSKPPDLNLAPETGRFRWYSAIF
jgi:hypothetical protein